MAATALARASLREVNARLIAIERAMTLNEGLPNRDWFKHQIYAPGFYTGYGVKTLPAVRESIEQKDWKLAEEQIERVGKVLENAGEAIQGARRTDARGAIAADGGRRNRLPHLSGACRDCRKVYRRLRAISRWRFRCPRLANCPAYCAVRGGRRRTARGEIAAAEEIALRDYGGAHRAIFVSALRPG